MTTGFSVPETEGEGEGGGVERGRQAREREFAFHCKVSKRASAELYNDCTSLGFHQSHSEFGISVLWHFFIGEGVGGLRRCQLRR